MHEFHYLIIKNILTKFYFSYFIFLYQVVNLFVQEFIIVLISENIIDLIFYLWIKCFIVGLNNYFVNVLVFERLFVVLGTASKSGGDFRGLSPVIWSFSIVISYVSGLILVSSFFGCFIFVSCALQILTTHKFPMAIYSTALICLLIFLSTPNYSYFFSSFTILQISQSPIFD